MAANPRPRRPGAGPRSRLHSSDEAPRDPTAPRFSGAMDRSAVVMGRRQAGVKECYDWRRNTEGQWDQAFVARVVRGEPVFLRHLCALPRLLPLLAQAQVGAWLAACCVDLGYDPETRPRDQASTAVTVLYEDYVDWCFGDGVFVGQRPSMETVPYGAVTRVLRELLPGKRRVRPIQGYDRDGTPIIRPAAIGLELRGL